MRRRLETSAGGEAHRPDREAPAEAGSSRRSSRALLFASFVVELSNGGLGQGPELQRRRSEVESRQVGVQVSELSSISAPEFEGQAHCGVREALRLGPSGYRSLFLKCSSAYINCT